MLDNCMKLTRRSFVRLFPLGIIFAAIGVASLWFPKQESDTTSSDTVRNVSSAQIDWPVTWNGDRPIVVDPKDYRLRVEGAVSNPLQLTLEELGAMPSVNESTTISCVGRWSALVTWEGVSLSRLLRLAEASSKLDHVTIESLTGYTIDIRQNDIANPGTLIALKAGSAPLKIEHGYPTRLVLPARPGIEWVKQVGRIVCTKT